jgi:hypothetical protein
VNLDQAPNQDIEPYPDTVDHDEPEPSVFGATRRLFEDDGSEERSK